LSGLNSARPETFFRNIFDTLTADGGEPARPLHETALGRIRTDGCQKPRSESRQRTGANIRFSGLRGRIWQQSLRILLAQPIQTASAAGAFNGVCSQVQRVPTPPSIMSSPPTMNADSSEARKTIALAISPGLPKRPAG